MKILVTGSSGYLGEALASTLRAAGHETLGLDLLPGPCTDVVGSIADGPLLDRCLRGVRAVMHTATLHKPHVGTHSHAAFVDTNVTGTLRLLEAATAAGVGAFVYTSTTSVFGDALAPPAGTPAAWIEETVAAVPKNIYGVTKSAAEDLCQLFHRNHGLAVMVLRTSRFFPEPDDSAERRSALDDANLKVVELLYRRVDIQDVVDAHTAALLRAPQVGFDKLIVSATSPFNRDDLALLRGQASRALRLRVPGFESVFRARGWAMLEDIDRVYVNQRARSVLEWEPKYDFGRALHDLARDHDPRSPLARSIRFRGYHAGRFADGLYPVDTRDGGAPPSDNARGETPPAPAPPG